MKSIKEVSDIKNLNMLSKAYTLWKELKRTGNGEISMRVRLFAFFACFLLTVVMSFLLILMMTGTFNKGAKESHLWMENELGHLTRDVYNNYGKLSIQGITLARSISENLSRKMAEKGIEPSRMKKNPELLEYLLESQMDYLMTTLKGARSSGVFLILDATVNPALKDSDYSRAGIFLKNTEPNIVNAADANIRYLRGPISCAKNHTLEVLPQWKLEFNIKENAFFNTLLDTAKNSKLPLSRLYHWSQRLSLDSSNESAMLLSLPLISPDGTVFGICGFEVSSMLFKLSYSPDNSIYFRIFTTLSPVNDDYININGGLVAGNYYLTSYLAGKNVRINKEEQNFYRYHAENEMVYRGLQGNISLYPANSAFTGEKWVLAVMMPEKDLKEIIAANNRILFLAFALLMILSLLVAVIISERYIDPVLSALKQIKTSDRSTISKTRFVEINDLLEFLAAQDEAQEEHKREEKESSAAAAEVVDSDVDLSHFNTFIKNIETLSTAERAVFNLYMEGHDAKEITEILFLSMNTIKTHNKRIYMKLNVTSRKELMIYVQMMKQKLP